MKNKKGAMSSGAVILVIAILLGAYFFVPSVSTTVNGLFKGAPAPTEAPIYNSIVPIITATAVDRQSAGTSVGTSGNQYSVNSGAFGALTLGTTTAQQGQLIDILFVNNTQYHNKLVTGVKSTPTTFPISVQLDKNASVTENMYNTVGQVMSNGLGAWTTNQTRLGNGATYNFKDEMQAASLTSTGDMLCVIEIVNGVNASTSPLGAVLTGGPGVTFVGTSKPTWYTTNTSNSNVYLYDVKALDSSATQTFNLQINSKTTGEFGASAGGNFGVSKICYTKETFLDPNSGKVVTEVADSNGLLKSIARYEYKVAFT
ncbi:MAG: hypothetical protein WC758_07740 [Candidatus Woesearchaeota archaeon]|jgi:hypothetical protein